MDLHLKKKIGSLLMIGFAGDNPSGRHHILRDIQRYNLGGVILFDKLLALGYTTNNITSPQNIAALTNKLQNLRDQPLLIAVDQEGGMVSRFTAANGFPTTISPKELSQNLKFTQSAARQTAHMLREAGVNFNLAPSVDLDLFSDNPIIGKYGRSFSKRAETVISHSSLWIEEHQKNGILSCLKHFPGHGSSRTDSHQGFTDISKTWEQDELKPYEALLANTDAVMVGHLFNQNIDDNLPASLSHKTITGLLRKELQYDGSVITDDMQMGAIINDYGLEEACCMAIMAGADMLIIGNNLHYDSEIVPKIITYMIEAITDGRLSEERITEACNRVNILQKRCQKDNK